MKKLINLLLCTAYANTNAASKLYICATAQNTALSQSDYELLTWVEIKGLGQLGETGKSTNILNYNTWGDTVTQKGKGMTDAGSPTVECARIPTDPGQVLLRTASTVGNNNNYAFKILRSDGVTSTTGTVQYNRGMVAGPTRPNGGNEDFDLEIFTLALQQEEIVVNPTSGGVAPYNTAIPTISGTFTSGQVITAANGTWAGDATITYGYEWYANNIKISGAASGTYTLTASEVGKRIVCRVTASNGAGAASMSTAPSAAVS